MSTKNHTDTRASDATIPSPEGLGLGASPVRRILRLTLKRKWFEMIASGVKKEEYRSPGKWILSRLEGKEYDRVEFKNGYGPNVPNLEVEYLVWDYGAGRQEWGGGNTPGSPLVVIRLGNVISANVSRQRPLPAGEDSLNQNQASSG